MNIRENVKARVLILGGIAGLLVLASLGAVHHTSQTGFCVSCHEMKSLHAGWNQGTHAQTHCFDCHVDQGFAAHVKAKANGLRQVYVHLTRKVDMDKVTARVPSHRCARCHDMGNKEKFGERVVTAHLKHREAKLECLVCHSTSGHSREAFAGFTQESCKECHSRKPQETPTPYLKRPPCTRPDQAQAAVAVSGASSR